MREYNGEDTRADFKRAGWFQRMLNSLWPSLRGCIERDILRAIIEPSLSSAVPGLRFADTYLGDVPPVLHGARCVPVSGEAGGLPQEVHLIFDVEFNPDGFNLSLALGPLRAAVSGISFRGNLCIVLVGLISRVPVVRGLKVYFPNIPSLSFSFAGVARALPVPPEKLKGYILDAIASRLVLPNKVVMNLDAFMLKYSESDFYEFHTLNNMFPCGHLRLQLTALEGPLLQTMKERVYLTVCVGCQKKSTALALPQQLASVVKDQDFVFVLYSLIDQDVSIELYREDTERVFLACDQLAMRTNVSACEVAQELAQTNMARFALSPLGSTAAGLLLTLAGEFTTLEPTVPQRWDQAKVQLFLNVDAVVGLGKESDGKRFSVRAYLTGGRALPPVSTQTCTAGVGTVAAARALHATMERIRCAEAKERIRLLHQRGAQLTPEEVSWLLPGNVTPIEAERLMREVENEGQANPNIHVRRSIEVLFEETLELEVFDPLKQGLKVEVWDEDAREISGMVEWSSLSWLADCPGLQDDLNDYPLKPPKATKAPSGPTPMIHLQRSMLTTDYLARPADGLNRMLAGIQDGNVPLQMRT